MWLGSAVRDFSPAGPPKPGRAPEACPSPRVSTLYCSASRRRMQSLMSALSSAKRIGADRAVPESRAVAAARRSQAISTCAPTRARSSCRSPERRTRIIAYCALSVTHSCSSTLGAPTARLVFGYGRAWPIPTAAPTRTSVLETIAKPNLTFGPVKRPIKAIHANKRISFIVVIWPYVS